MRLADTEVRTMRDTNEIDQQGSGMRLALPDYSSYELSMMERVLCIMVGAIISYGIGYLFYHQWIVSLLIACSGWFIPGYWRQYMLDRRRAAMSLRFKQALFSLSSSLSAGRSVRMVLGRRLRICECWIPMRRMISLWN